MFTRIGYFNLADDSVTSRLIYGEDIEPTVFELIGIPSINHIWLTDVRTDETYWEWERS